MSELETTLKLMLQTFYLVKTGDLMKDNPNLVKHLVTISTDEAFKFLDDSAKLLRDHIKENTQK